MNKKVFRWIKVIVLLYAVIGIALYYLQDTILLRPDALPRDYKYAFDFPFGEVEIPINKTDTINMIQFYPTDSIRKGVVIYFHGNKGNVRRYRRFVTRFTKNGYEVWMPDYPGYGKSVGTISEKALYQQAEQVYTMAASRYQQDSIIIYGKSFGTGIAAYLASVKRCRQLILETPYYSVAHLFGCYAPIYPTTRMANYKMPTHRFLEEVSVPVSIFHGTSDGVIPYRCAVKLKKVLKPTDLFVTIPGGNHRDLNDYPVMKQTLDSLLR